MKLGIFDDIEVTYSTEVYLNNVKKYIDCEIAEEKFGLVVIRILDTLIGIMNNTKALLSDPRKSMKRSAFKAYTESNVLQMKKLNKAKYTDVYEVEIPVFKGMRVTYPMIIHILNECLKDMSIESRSNNAINIVKGIHDGILSNSSISDAIREGTQVYDKSVKTAISKHLNKAINITEDTNTVLFSDSFKSMTEFHETKDNVFEIIDEYRLLDTVYDSMLKIQEITDRIIELIKEDRATITNSDITGLSMMVHTLGNMYDTYAVLVHRLQNVDNNFVYVCKALIDHIQKR